MEEQIRIPVAIDSFNFKKRDNVKAISKKLFCGECNISKQHVPYSLHHLFNWQ
jgi:hypothetical protein